MDYRRWLLWRSSNPTDNDDNDLLGFRVIYEQHLRLLLLLRPNEIWELIEQIPGVLTDGQFSLARISSFAYITHSVLLASHLTRLPCHETRQRTKTLNLSSQINKFIRHCPSVTD